MNQDEQSTPHPDITQHLQKEIDLIQGCISRMAHNSFMIKGWAITLVVIIWAIMGTETISIFSLLLLLLPTIMFWGLDSYFLLTERRYRSLYNWVLNERLEKDSLALAYNLNPSRFKKEAGSVLSCFFSITLALFYGVLVIVIIGAFVLCMCMSS